MSMFGVMIALSLLVNGNGFLWHCLQHFLCTISQYALYVQSTLANYTPIIYTHWINARFLAAGGICPTFYSTFTYI
jgi:hypothetical protein